MTESISPITPTTFGLVHGAWHGAWCWRYVSDSLREKGHNPVAIDLPIEDPHMTFDDHAAFIASELRQYEGNPIVLVGHSRSGNVIPRIAGRLSISKMLFLCGTMGDTITTEQQASLQNEPQQISDEFREGIVDIGGGLSTYDPAMVREVFYHDCPEELTDWAISNLRHQRISTNEMSLNEWPSVPSEYILCTNDRVIRPEWSRFITRQLFDKKPFELPGGHSPFLYAPEKLASALESLAS
jgi:pimeloyl-ACP methyl ester carboxylesterase